MADETAQTLLQFTGHRHLTTRLLLSTLTGRPIRISQIRSSSHIRPGLTPYETNFIRLLDSVTNGAQVQFSMTGTTLVYRPGLITGSAEGLGASFGVIRHEIPRECARRGASWWLIPLCLLSPFSKGNMNVVLHGEGCVTGNTPAGDISVDTVRTAILPLFKNFGIERNIELRILKRSCAVASGKSAGGEVQLVFNQQVRLPKTLHLMNPGRVKRIRGVAYAVGVPGANNSRVIEVARGILNKFVPDTYIFSDASGAPLIPTYDPKKPGEKKKGAVGFGLSLVAESSTNCLYSADVASPPQGGTPAEDIGKQCAYQLLEKIAQGGCVESTAAPAALILMSMGSEDVGRLALGRDVLASEDIVQLARDSKVFGGSGWGFRDASGEKANGEIVVSVVGRGVGNVGRKVA
ncbi:RNA 3'-terminal phosphate cyclase-like protein-like protein [Corynespora cassiicola Philippines]|uniref:RNA 3'-terminal phosphate cyclase-like protein-like protein n=1 Tax=Corynespora cassiicola Philippines TaxID=1448308 RepID=A0A2T2NDJ7_CORCC|nr:RNA 3'-terminal phosphate cyclase-like protein-like protein [Corynespora cassiicola Philippines]